MHSVCWDLQRDTVNSYRLIVETQLGDENKYAIHMFSTPKSRTIFFTLD